MAGVEESILVSRAMERRPVLIVSSCPGEHLFAITLSFTSAQLAIYSFKRLLLLTLDPDR